MRTLSLRLAGVLAFGVVALVVLVGARGLRVEAAPLGPSGRPQLESRAHAPLPAPTGLVTVGLPVTPTAPVTAPVPLANAPPAQPLLHAPPDGAAHVRLDPALEVSVSDPDGDALTVTVYGRRLLASTAPTFTLVALPDTQYYACGALCSSDPALFAAQTQWAVDTWVTRNVAFLTHLGDIVEFGDLFASHWANADAAISLLEATARPGFPHGLPYGLAVGNHDQIGGTDLYNATFGVDRFQGRPYYGGAYGADNNNHFERFAVGPLAFLVLHLEYDANADPAVLAWANAVLQAHPEHRAIVVSHFLIETGNPGPFGGQGQAIYQALRHNPNLFLMLCGHVAGEGRRADTYHGRTVHTLLADYQGRPNGGDGWLRTLEFVPQEDRIHVRTYSPVLDQWEIDADSDFTLSYDMQRSVFQVLGVYTDVVSGSHLATGWDGLSPGTRYEWYVTVADGISTTVGPLWTFATMDLITKTADDRNGPPLQVGDLVRYAITVTNELTMTLTGVVVTDTLPPGVAFVSAEPPTASGSQPLVWNVGQVAPGQSWMAQIVARVDGTADPIGGNVAVVCTDQRGRQAAGPVFPPGGGDVVPLHAVHLPLVTRNP
jgi:uncharacterized repeat protein (TIGR01451 family)